MRMFDLLGVLPGPVDVVAPGDNDWKLETDQHKKINVASIYGSEYE